MDKEKRRVYYYDVNIDGCTTEAVRIDKFHTEDRIIYKSSSSMPLSQGPFESKEKIALDGTLTLESYSSDRLFPKKVGSIYIEKEKNGVSFLSRFGAKFIYLEGMPTGKKPFIFSEGSPVTYLPILGEYDYRKGGPQVFEAITVFSEKLPPMKRMITLTSIRDEYIKIGSRKINTEKLILKIRGYPQGSVWAAKSDKTLIKADLPGLKLIISRSFSPREVKAKNYEYKPMGYTSDDVTFKGKYGEISGTLTIPEGEGKFPGAIFIWGAGPHNRSYEGLFDSMADILSKNGIAVLRFDKPGTGSSGGSYLSYSATDQIEDIKTAAAYLAARDRIAPEGVTAIAHAEGADILLRSISDKSSIRSIVLLSPDLFSLKEGEPAASRRLVPPDILDGGYSQTLDKCIQDTASKLESTRGNWTFILRKLCVATDMKWRLRAEAIREVIKAVKLPVLIVQGRKDESVYPEYASVIDKALQDAGNDARVLAYYAYLGRFLGNKVADCVHKVRYEADEEVVESIANWIKAKPVGEVIKIDLT